jgi:hypothetical protein
LGAHWWGVCNVAAQLRRYAIDPALPARNSYAGGGGVVMPKAREWPTELRKPISAKELAWRGAPLGLLFERAEPERKYNIRLGKNYAAEVRSRTEVMLGFFHMDWPRNDYQWLMFLMRLCEHWEIPAFEITTTKPKGPGRSKKWTDKQNYELFADVNALVERRGMSENAACHHIARNPRMFKSRYDVAPKRGRQAKDAGRTLHRQYERVKRQIQDDSLFRLRHFSRPFESIEYGPELIKEAIRRYAIAQKF